MINVVSHGGFRKYGLEYRSMVIDLTMPGFSDLHVGLLVELICLSMFVLSGQTSVYKLSHF